MTSPSSIPNFRDLCIAGWKQGKSGGAIANELQDRYHVRVTRNMVIGHVARAVVRGEVPQRGVKQPRIVRPNPHKFSAHNQPKRKLSVAIVPKRKPGPAPALPFLELGFDERSLQWHQDDGCAYLLNDDARAPLWCNAPVLQLPDSTTAWCPYHYRKCYSQGR